MSGIFFLFAHESWIRYDNCLPKLSQNRFLLLFCFIRGIIIIIRTTRFAGICKTCALSWRAAGGKIKHDTTADRSASGKDLDKSITAAMFVLIRPCVLKFYWLERGWRRGIIQAALAELGGSCGEFVQWLISGRRRHCVRNLFDSDGSFFLYTEKFQIYKLVQQGSVPKFTLYECLHEATWAGRWAETR